MKVGVYIPITSKKSGGFFTFEESILKAILQNKSHHEFYFFYYGNPPIKDNNFSVKHISLDKFNNLPADLSSENKSLLNKAAYHYNIDLMWFITPLFEEINIPYIYTVWDLGHRFHPYFPELNYTEVTWEEREKRYKRALPKASFVFTGTKVGKKEIVRCYQIPEKKIYTLPLPLPSFVDESCDSNSDLIRKYRLPVDYLFYPAQFWPHKNHILILLSLRILKEKYNLNASVVFTGLDMGNEKYIKEETCRLGLEKEVYFLGFVDRKMLIALYSNAKALLFPSFLGPDNLPPLEAFALKCPVLAAKTDGAREQLGDAAMLINPTHEKKWALAIKLILQNDELRKRMIQKGLERMEKWKPEDYFKKACRIIDGFKPYRRCWSRKEIYKHF